VCVSVCRSENRCGTNIFFSFFKMRSTVIHDYIEAYTTRLTVTVSHASLLLTLLS
jgi:hypothetical protein